MDDVAALGIVTSKNKKSPKKSVDDHPLPILFREKIIKDHFLNIFVLNVSIELLKSILLLQIFRNFYS